MYRPQSLLTPPITVQQVYDFKPGCRESLAANANLHSGTSNNNNTDVGLSALVSSSFQGPLPRFVLPDNSSYYGDLHPYSLQPHGLGVMLLKHDASGVGAAFDGVFAPAGQSKTHVTAASGSSGNNHSDPSEKERERNPLTRQNFTDAVLRRKEKLLAFTSTFARGDRYGGYWVDGKCCGEGALVTSTFTFQGNFLDGKPHGVGHMKYMKSFVDRMPANGGGGALENGIGAFLLKSVTSVLLAPLPDVGSGSGGLRPREYLGDYDKIFLRHGRGMMKYANGGSYDGEWCHNRRDGHGKFVSAETGEQYEGMWARDERHGYGKVMYADGSYFKGLFDRGVRSGEGLLLLPNGDEYYGNFEKNRIQGEGTMKFKNGDVYVGDWKDGMRYGKGKYVLKKRRITVMGEFVKGLIEGEGLVEYPGTGIFVGQFERGERRTGSMFWYSAEAIAEQEAQQQKEHMSAPPPLPKAESEGAVTTSRQPQKQQQQQQQQGDEEGAVRSDNAKRAPPLQDPRLCYQGEWVAENMHGQGLLWYRSGDFFSGRMMKNMRHGPGNLRYGNSSGSHDSSNEIDEDKEENDGENKKKKGVLPAREYSGMFQWDRRHGFGIEQSRDGSIKAGRWEHDVFVEGYEGEWDNHAFNGVGRLRLSLPTFFQQLEHKAIASPLSPFTTAHYAAVACPPPPISIPSPLLFLRACEALQASSSSSSSTAATAVMDATVLNVFHHPESAPQFAEAQACWRAAVAVAQELNDLFMVEHFGIFRNSRRDGSGMLRLPFACEQLPETSTGNTSTSNSHNVCGGAAEVKSEKEEKDKKHQEHKKSGAVRSLFGGKKSATTAATAIANAPLLSPLDLLLTARSHQLRLPPTLLLRRHVMKGRWESNVFDCHRGVWAFPSGETYVGAFAAGARSGSAAMKVIPASNLNASAKSEEEEEGKEGLLSGGLLYFPDGSVFMGRWHRNAPCGKGVFICKDLRNAVYERQAELLSPFRHRGGVDGAGRTSRSRKNRVRETLTTQATTDSKKSSSTNKGEDEVSAKTSTAATAAATGGVVTGSSFHGRPTASLRESASRRRKALRQSLTRCAVGSEGSDSEHDGDRTQSADADPSLLAEAQTQRKRYSSTAATAANEAAAATTLSSFFGIDFIVNLFTGSAGDAASDSDGSGSNDSDASDGEEGDGGRVGPARLRNRERVTKAFTGFENHYYLFGRWYQETDENLLSNAADDDASGNKVSSSSVAKLAKGKANSGASGTAAAAALLLPLLSRQWEESAMPFSDYVKKVLPRLPILPADKRALCYANTTMEDALIGFRAPPLMLGQFFSSARLLGGKDGSAASAAGSSAGGSGSGSGSGGHSSNNLGGGGDAAGFTGGGAGSFLDLSSGTHGTGGFSDKGAAVSLLLGNNNNRNNSGGSGGDYGGTGAVLQDASSPASDAFYLRLLAAGTGGGGGGGGASAHQPSLTFSSSSSSGPTVSMSTSTRESAATLAGPGVAPIPPVPRPAGMNVARTSGEAICFYPSTGVCVQSSFLDGMARLAVPYRAGSDLDRYLAELRRLYWMLAPQLALPSEQSEVSYLLTTVRALRQREVFSSPDDIVSFPTSFSSSLPVEKRQKEINHSNERQNQSVSKKSRLALTTTEKSREDLAESPMPPLPVRGLGVRAAYVAGALPTPRFTPPPHHPVNRPGHLGGFYHDEDAANDLAALEKPQPLSACTICGRAYSFFREAGCCTLCFRSCCSSCLNNWEIVSKSASGLSTSSSSSSAPITCVNSGVAGGGYTEVSVLLASSYYLLQKLRKGPEAFREPEETEREAPAAATSSSFSTSSSSSHVFCEVTSKQLTSLLVSTSSLPVCADCVRAALLRVEKQVQWIPLRLFSSVTKFENEDRLEAAQSKALAAREQHQPQRREESSEKEAGDGGAESGENPIRYASETARAVEVDEAVEGVRERASTRAARPCKTGTDGEEEEEEEELLPDAVPVNDEGEKPQENSTLAVSCATPRRPTQPSSLLLPEGEGDEGEASEVNLLDGQPSPQPRLPSLPSTPTKDEHSSNSIHQSSVDPRATEDSEGYAVYRGYTARGVPHLVGELWWWPKNNARKGRNSLLPSILHENKLNTDNISSERRCNGGAPAVELTITDRSAAAAAVSAAAAATMATNSLPTNSKSNVKNRNSEEIGSEGNNRLHASAAPRVSSFLYSSSSSSSPAGAQQHLYNQPSQQQRYYYYGSFSAGKRCGHGTLLFSNGEKYVGFFQNNALHGEGFYFSEDGAVLHGLWRRNRLISVFYVGDLEESSMRRTGQGICFYDAPGLTSSLFFRFSCNSKNQNTEEGTEGFHPIASGLFVNGHEVAPGTSSSPSATSAGTGLLLAYNGAWAQGRKHGTGTLWLRDSTVYEGQFAQDRVEGRGRLLTASSAFYGHFMNNVRLGYGVEFFYDQASQRPRHHSSNTSNIINSNTSDGNDDRKRGKRRSSKRVSLVVEGQWSRDVSDGFVRLYSKNPNRIASQSEDELHKTSNKKKEEVEPVVFDITETTYRNGNERDDCFVAPLMRGDAERDACLLCQKRFHLFLRRHHCRLCGEVVCDSCSPRCAQLPAHFYASSEEKNTYQKRARDAALMAAAAAVTPTFQDSSSSSSTRNCVGSGCAISPLVNDEQRRSSHAKNNSSSNADTFSSSSATTNAPPAQRVCDQCFCRLEQRRQCVVHVYADRSVYCGGLSQGRWVSRGLYWRADGLFFVFDDRGKLIQRDSGSENNSSNNNNPEGDRAAFSPSILQDAALTKEKIDTDVVAFSVSSPTSALDSFLVWWTVMNTRCMLALSVAMDFPQLRAYKRIASFSRNYQPNCNSSHNRKSNSSGGRSGATQGSGVPTEVLAGSVEAKLMSVAHLFSSSSSSPTSTSNNDSSDEADYLSALQDAGSPLALRISTDFQRWLTFPSPPPSSWGSTAAAAAAVLSPSSPQSVVLAPLLLSKFISYTDALALHRRREATTCRRPIEKVAGVTADSNEEEEEGEEDDDELGEDARNAEVALVRAARFRPSVMPRPPPYPFRAKSKANTSHSNNSSNNGVQSAPLLSPPPPLSAVDMRDEELLQAVAAERVESFLPFLPPSQLNDDVLVGEETKNAESSNEQRKMKLLSCYNYQPLFPPTPPTPAFRTNRPVKWSHWQTTDVPVFNPTRLPLTRQSTAENHSNSSDSPAIVLAAAAAAAFPTPEQQLYYGNAFSPIGLASVSEAVERGKICKIAEVLVERQERQQRRQRRQERELASQSENDEMTKRGKRKTIDSSDVEVDDSCDDDDAFDSPVAVLSLLTPPSASASATAAGKNTSTTSSQARRGVRFMSKNKHKVVRDEELVDGFSVAALAQVAAGREASSPEHNSNSNSTSTTSRKSANTNKEFASLLAMGRGESAWLPESFAGPFTFSLHSDGI